MRRNRRTSSRFAWRRPAQGAALLLLVPVGVAHLAANSVPVTGAGVTEQALSFPTSLALTNATYDGQLTGISARLTSAFGPISGAKIVFRMAGEPVCTALTSNTGVAACNPAPSDGQGPYTAAFDGLGSFQPSQANGHIVRQP